MLGWAVPVMAQQAKERTVTGLVTDENKEPMIGVTVLVADTKTGAITDANGRFTVKVPEGKNELRFSFIGYESASAQITDNNTVNVQLLPNTKTLDEVVVIGYGTQRKGDLTGAVANVSTKDFNKGAVSSPEQLINGKISGVQIMSNSGSPTAGSSIRIRGGASLNASNDPLIVLDGVPLENGGISGNNGNFLSLINPNDIESITILKDASSTAIYGSRASNGVMIITTKKSSESKLRINFSSTNSLQNKTKTADMLSTSEFRNVIQKNGTANQIALLGNSDTNWNDQIYQLAYGTDNNLSLSGAFKHLPYRVSFGYYNQDGIVKTDNVQRITNNIALTPSFFDEHLKVNLGVKSSLNKNRFANDKAIWAATTTNPTIPIYSNSAEYGGYNEAIDATGKPVTGAVMNPLGLINQYKSTSDINRMVSNLDLDYKFHLLPELKFHLSGGYDYAEGQGKVVVPASAIQYFTSGGRNYKYGPQKLENKLITTYFNYNKELTAINSTIDATAGYDYQFWKSSTPFYKENNEAGESQKEIGATDQRHVLISFYGRVNYTLASRYMLTATVRRDGTSRFPENNRWGTFPSVALGWRISDESFLKNITFLSNLKLRASYGVTGQQEGIGNYNYIPVYTVSQTGAEYIFGNTPVLTYRSEPYVNEFTWENTKAYNYGVDFGFLKNRISGSFEYYTRKTEDLLATVATPATTNFEKTILTNVGNVDSKGYELNINLVPIETKDWNWNMSFNASWQKQTIQNMSIHKGIENTYTAAGPTIDSYHFQSLSEGYAPYSFYLYHQLYDPTGKPIEGAYADLNKDGMINSKDLYHYHSPSPDYILGFSTSVRYQKLTLGTSLRANIGNYAYNGMAMNTGAWGTVSYNSAQLNRLNASYLKTGFQSRQFLSDYYVENASFLKMDNITVGYNVGQIMKNVNLNVNAMIQNVFTITKYTGVDPEVPNGMDNSFYPRPRIYSVTLGLDF